MIQAVGFVAAILTSLAFLPQVIKTARTGDVGDFSLVTLLVQNAGVALWVVYGVAIGSAPLIASNSVTLALMLVLLGFKLRFDFRR